VGAGIGGLTAAYELRNYPNLDTRVFEASDRIGGRVATTEINGYHHDFGGKYILESNHNTIQLCQQLNIELKQSKKRRYIFNHGKKSMVPSSSAGLVSNIGSSLKLLARYRLPLIRLLRRIGKDTKELNQFYKMIEDQVSPDELFNRFDEYLQTTCDTYLLELGISSKLINQFFNPIQRGIYMQNMDSMAAIFVLLLLGAFNYDLYIVDPSNEELLAALLREISGKIPIRTHSKINSITYENNGFTLHSGNQEYFTNHLFQATSYAAMRKIEYHNFPNGFYDYLDLINQLNYNSVTFKHFIKATPKSKISGYDVKDSFHINNDTPIFLIDPLQDDEKYYLVTATSDNPPLDDYFEDWKYLREPIQWREAYPQYTPDTWQLLRSIKEFEFNHQDTIFNNYVPSTNRYITTIETSVLCGKQFAAQIISEQANI